MPALTELVLAPSTWPCGVATAPEVPLARGALTAYLLRISTDALADTVGDALDNALMKSRSGRCATQPIKPLRPGAMDDLDRESVRQEFLHVRIRPPA